MSPSEMEILEKREEIEWLQEASVTMRVKLNSQPDNLGPASDKVAQRILAVLNEQLETLLRGWRAPS